MSTTFNLGNLQFLLPMRRLKWIKRGHGGEMQGMEFVRYAEIDMGFFDLFFYRTQPTSEYQEATGISKRAWYVIKIDCSRYPTLLDVEIQDIFIDEDGRRYFVKDKKDQSREFNVYTLHLEEEY